MTKSAFSVFASLFFLALAPIGACGGTDDAAPGSFAAASKSDRDAAVLAAAGLGSMLSTVSVFLADFDSLAQPACPTREATPGGVRLIGGCEAASGLTYDGVADLDNVPLFSDSIEVTPGAPMQQRFDGFVVSSEAISLAFDGTLAQSVAQPETAYTTALDLTTDFAAPGAAMRFTTRGDLACTVDGDGPLCEMLPGVVGSVEGFGSFDVTGRFGFTGDQFEGALTLTGVDVMTVDFDAGIDGCAPVTIEGAPAGEFCLDDTPIAIPEPEPEPEPEPGVRIVGYGVGCGEDLQSWSAFVEGEAIEANVELLETGAEASRSEFHALTPLDQFPGATDREWEVQLVPGSDTEFTCEDHDALTYRFTATGSDGTRACLVDGHDPSALLEPGCATF